MLNGPLAGVLASSLVRLATRRRCAQPQVLVKGQPGVRLELEVEFLANQRHLPRVTIRRAA